MQITTISIDAVKFDARNPRIAIGVEGFTEPLSDEYIALNLGKASPADEEQGASTTYASLKASIRANKGLINPIIVTPSGDGKYIVVEGNTRVAIFRELLKEADDADREVWKVIPCVVHSEASEEDEHAIRLQSHLVGPRPWKAYAKGKYLHHLYHDKKWSMTRLLDFCGGNARKREVEEYISAYADMQDFYRDRLQAGLGYSKFSAFVELQKQGIKQSIVRAGYTIKDFADWLHEGQIAPLASVRQLPRILANPAAKKVFLDRDAREAIKLLDQPNTGAVLKDVPLEQLANALAARIRTEPFSRIREIMEDQQGVVASSLTDAYEELKGILKAIDSDFDGS